MNKTDTRTTELVKHVFRKTDFDAVSDKIHRMREEIRKLKDLDVTTFSVRDRDLVASMADEAENTATYARALEGELGNLLWCPCSNELPSRDALARSASE